MYQSAAPSAGGGDLDDAFHFGVQAQRGDAVDVGEAGLQVRFEQSVEADDQHAAALVGGAAGGGFGHEGFAGARGPFDEQLFGARDHVEHDELVLRVLGEFGFAAPGAFGGFDLGFEHGGERGADAVDTIGRRFARRVQVARLLRSGVAVDLAEHATNSGCG